MKDDSIILRSEAMAAPAVPTDWDYDKSVEKVRGFVYKWKNLTDEIKQELLVAREALSTKGGYQYHRKVLGNKFPRTWETYCHDIGVEKRTVNGWLALPAHVAHASGENEWDTPAEYIEAARSAMGSIDTDPASNDEANKRIKANLFYTPDIDGRDNKWRGNVWMNPPYAQPLIAEFCDILVSKYNSREFQQACILVNNATETVWFQALLSISKCVCFPSGRIKFIDKAGNPSGAPLQGQAILYAGKRTEQFENEFSQFGPVLWTKK